MLRKLCRFIMLLVIIAGLAVPVHAYAKQSIEDTAKDLKIGEEVTCYIDDYGEEYGEDFKIITSGGSITIQFESRVYKTYFFVCDDNGQKIIPTDINAKAGQKISGNTKSSAPVGFKWNSTVKKSSGTITYGNLSKGTYYIRVYSEYDYTGKDDTDYDDYYEYGDVRFTVSRNTDNDTSGSASIESGDTELALYITLKQGKTFQLGASFKNPDYETPVWKSSNSKVATVSQTGLVKGIKKGAATITVSLGGQKQSIRIVVTD